MWQHFVYLHRKADSGEVFYIGKGTRKRGRCERAYCGSSRSKWWHRVVAKHGLAVELFASCRTDSESQRIERQLIASYGRHRLVNLTDGGDGHWGIEVSASLRAKRSANAKKPRSKAWIESIQKSRKHGGNGGVVKLGDRLPESWREHLAAAKIGSRNPMFGITGSQHPNSRKVIDRRTGQTFDSVLLASEHHGFKMKTLYNWLSGHRPNTTTLEFV